MNDRASSLAISPSKKGRTAGALALSTAIVVLSALAHREGKAQAPTGPTPAKAELLARPPFDRITLVDDTSWDVEPLAPRPLPPFDPKKRARPKKASDPPPSEGNIGTLAAKSTIKAPPPVEKADEDESQSLVVHMLEGDVRDYRVKRESIKSVAYFEDLLIVEANRLTAIGDFPKAFEYLLAVREHQPKWPGLVDAVDRLLFEEGSKALLDNDGERGLRLLGELYRRRPTYPGLGDRLASSFGQRIRRAFDVGAYAKGRQVIHDLERIAPDHEVFKLAVAHYEAAARALADRAAREKGAARLDLLLRAAGIWPKLAGLEASYREAFAEVATLDVGVAVLQRPVGPWGASRITPLLYRPILADDGEEALRGIPPQQLAAAVESFEVSKGLRIKVKGGFQWNDGSRPVGAIDVARALADRAIPGMPGYSARWADLLERVEPTDEDTVEVRLTRPSLRPESWLVASVGPAHAGPDGWVSTVGKGRRPVGDGPYRWHASNGDVDDYLATGPAPIRRIREVRHASPGAAVAALVRGDISLLEAVGSDRVNELAAIDGIKVGRYTTPSLHRISLDGRTEALRNRSLRRALSLAIDRKTLLEETVLRAPADPTNFVADGPFLKGSYADVPDVAPLEYNPLLARMLVAAAKKELGGGLISLTFEHPPTAAARAVCAKIAEAWTLVDLKITLKEVSGGELDARLRSGGRYDLAYRESRPGDPFLSAGPTIAPGYDAPASVDPLASVASPRILQLLLQVDRAAEPTTATALLRQIDRESRDELPILPLWQLVDHYAYRTRIGKIPDTLDRIYQGIETWEVGPWYPSDPW